MISLTPERIAELARDIDEIRARRALRRRRHWPTSKIGPFAVQLKALEAEGVSQREMVEWLARRGCHVTQPTIQRYLKSLREAVLDAELP
jgi:arginine repressor